MGLENAEGKRRLRLENAKGTVLHVGCIIAIFISALDIAFFWLFPRLGRNMLLSFADSGHVLCILFCRAVYKVVA